MSPEPENCRALFSLLVGGGRIPLLRCFSSGYLHGSFNEAMTTRWRFASTERLFNIYRFVNPRLIFTVSPHHLPIKNMFKNYFKKAAALFSVNRLLVVISTPLGMPHLFLLPLCF